MNKMEKTGLRDAIESVLALPKKKFIESVDMCVLLSIDPRQTDQTIKGYTFLPHGHGKTKSVAVFTEEDVTMPHVTCGTEDLVKKIQAGQRFDCVLSTGENMKYVKSVAKDLRTLGLTPSSKTGTKLENESNLQEQVKRFVEAYVSFRNDKHSYVRLSIGRVSFTAEQLEENARQVLSTLQQLKPTKVKGQIVKGIQISTSMGQDSFNCVV